jgi:hypothetical protein
MKIIKSLTSIICALSIVSAMNVVAEADNSQDQFFNALSEQCGQRFEGEMTYPSEGQDSFAGKLLIAKIDICTSTEIRIPFAVGEDHSRTWIVSKTKKGLQLKHDHRHKDGTPDDVNMYGGLAGEEGSRLSQSFSADEHTATIIPAASTNVWTLTFSDSGKSLRYHLERHNAPRFTAELTRIER